MSVCQKAVIDFIVRHGAEVVSPHIYQQYGPVETVWKRLSSRTIVGFVGPDAAMVFNIGRCLDPGSIMHSDLSLLVDAGRASCETILFADPALFDKLEQYFDNGGY